MAPSRASCFFDESDQVGRESVWATSLARKCALSSLVRVKLAHECICPLLIDQLVRSNTKIMTIHYGEVMNISS